MDAMATDESPSQISDKIKEILFNKSAERISQTSSRGNGKFSLLRNENSYGNNFGP